jgi:2-oxoglutarate ferredoxin oxidoreductase subunit alpha
MDVMQARWGPNGDREALVLAPATVEEAFWVTLKCVNLAERLRTGVIMLAEGLLGLMREVIDIPDYASVPREDRMTPAEDLDPGVFYNGKMSEVRPFASFGTGQRSINGNWQRGDYAAMGTRIPLRGYAAQDYQIRRLHHKILERREDLTFYEADQVDDADVLIVAFGTQARTALYAKDLLRDQGVRAGVLRLITLWPFPEDVVREAAARAKLVIVPEMNMGQVRGEVTKALRNHSADIVGVNHVDTTYILPDEILSLVPESLRARRQEAHA